MATKATVTSPNSSSSLWKYDVFLSFRGEDTRKQVTDHLYHALNQKGIYTFRDDKELKRGKLISPELLKAIEESRFAVVILSKDYASSSWCLEELSKIVECNKVKAQTIIPVFYHVEPTEVRKQSGNYGEAFAKHQLVFKDDMEKVKRWKEALTEVASISGWDMKERHEAEAIQEIVKEILRDLNKAFSIGNNELVGMESRTKKMDLLLDIDLNDIRTIGVWGMGGIGKTTVAREVCRKINANFDASCFIDNVREEYEKNGILHLLNLVYKNLVDDEGNVYNYDMGVSALGKRLNSKRVLIILDDVDRLEQIEDLVGRAKYQHNRLGPGSRVIVTTRDKHLLKTYGEEYIYEVEKLNYDESLELLCQKAFKEDHIGAEFIEPLNDVVEYTDGYPLALTILGSFLFGRSVGEWLDTVAKLKKYPDKDILHMLRISLDGLDANEKSIFLDIACFFRGECEYRVKKILEGCGFYPEIGVNVLIEKSLITMSGDKIWMHDLLHKLGRDIVHQECPEEPGKRSRVWSREDARHVLVTDTGTEAVQGIFSVRYYGDEVLHLSDEELHLSTNTIGKMKRLRLLRVENACLPEPHGSLSNELRLLEWHRCPLISLPSSFQPSKLVELNLSNSRIERLWKETTIRLEKLILINLTNCKYLKRTPDFSMFPNLERLILEDCKGLSEVHPTIRELKQLVLLNLKGCESLKSLPQGINLKSLETFILSGCTKLDKFPEIVGNMDNLSELYLDTTAIKELPISIKRLTGLVLVNLRDCKNLLSLPNEICCLTSLKTLDVSGCSHLEELPENLGSLEQLVELHANRSAIIEVPSLKNLKKLCFGECSRVAQRSSWQSVICSCFSPKEECITFQLPIALSGFSSLTSLSLRKCNISEGAILEDIGSLSSLQILDLSENNFTSLPETICQLVNLRELSLNQCRSLDSFPRLPLSVRWVNTRDCPRLIYSRNRVILWPSKNGFTVIDGNISDGAKSNIIINDDFDSMLDEHFDSNQRFDSNLYLHYLQGLIYCGKTAAAVLGCNSFPEWCSERRIGSYVYIHLPVENSCETWIGLSLFVDFLTVENANFHEGLDLEDTFCVFSTDGSCRKLFVKRFEGMKLGRNGAVFMYFPRALFAERLKNANRILASVWTARSDIMVKMCGMHLLFNQDVPEFCSRLVLTLGKKLKSRSSIKHFKQILKEECTLEVHTNRQKWRNWSSNSSSSGSLQQRCTSTIDSDTTSPLRRNLYELMKLIIVLIQGSYARNYRFTFLFPSKAVPIGFFSLSFGNKTLCELPPNLFDEKQWVGFSLYAALPHPSDVDHLRVELRCYGSTNILVSFNVPVNRNIALVFHAPRVHFPEQLNQCHAVEAFLWTRMTSDVKVQMCGIRIAYEQDLADAVAMITDIALSGTNEHSPQFCIQVGRDFVEVFFSSDDEDADQFCLRIFEDCIPIYCSAREYETSMQEILALLKEEKPFVIAEAMIAKGNSKDSKLGFTILKIMAEDALYDSKKWQKGLEELLNCLFGYNVVIALILRGHILSELPPFNPFSSYGFCFPRLEILDWFQDYQATMRRTVIIKLPPNLNTDNKWCGLAVCASFVVRENPTEFLDNMSTSNNSFRLLCHLKTERCCLHPALISHITKDKFKWLYVGGFIWLIYISSSDLVLPELNEQSYLVVEIYNECSNVIIRNVGARLMYQQDVGEFGQSITRCVTSLFDDLFLLYQFMVSEEENPVNADETKTSTNGDSYVVVPQEILIQPSYTGKSEQDFDRLRIYNSCSPHYEILDWFGHHSISGPSVTIQLPPNVFSDRNWAGLTLCAYFSDLEHTTAVCDNFVLEVPHYVVCFLDAEEGGPQSLHEYQLSNDESKMSHNGELLWLSYIPRFWFSDQLNHCSHIKASFASDRGLRVQNCGLRFLNHGMMRKSLFIQ